MITRVILILLSYFINLQDNSEFKGIQRLSPKTRKKTWFFFFFKISKFKQSLWPTLHRSEGQLKSLFSCIQCLRQSFTIQHINLLTRQLTKQGRTREKYIFCVCLKAYLFEWPSFYHSCFIVSSIFVFKKLNLWMCPTVFLDKKLGTYL